MSKKITYFLGAGSSANTIPIVSSMYTRIKEIADELDKYLYNAINDNSYQNEMPDSNVVKHTDLLRGIIDDFNQLLITANDYYTVDTLARKYYLTNSNSEYENLKRLLIIYFTIEQYIFFESKIDIFPKRKSDNRYDSFIASIANRSAKGLELNGNIKILSWNYDLQFELSLRRFTEKTIEKIKKSYQLLPTLYCRTEKEKYYSPEQFAAIKLNGNAIFSETDKLGKLFTIFDAESNHEESKATKLGILLNEIAKLDFKNNSACRFLNFAWETNEDFDKGFKGRKHESYSDNLLKAEHIAAETEILVVIGYSFPIFNREIDGRLFEKMNKLQKVYIQDPYPNKIESTMRNAFRIFQKDYIDKMIEKGEDEYGNPIIHEITFEKESNVNQFVIPYELNQ